MKSEIVNWAVILLVVSLVFYGLDHLVMLMQGLPLNLDLTPVQ